MLAVYTSTHIPFLNALQEENLIQLVSKPTEDFVRIEKFENPSCACDAIHQIVIDNDSIIVEKNKYNIVAHPGYALPEDISDREIVVCITWLLRFRMKAFTFENFKRELKFDFFKIHDLNCCKRYTLKEDPVFLLEKNVVSLYGVGPTLEYVLKKLTI